MNQISYTFIVLFSFLTCIEPTCPTRAHMCTVRASPITISPLRPHHNHTADPSLREALLFIDATRAIVRSGTEPQAAIDAEKQRLV